MHKPTIIATEEFLDGELYYRMGGKDGKEATVSGTEEKPTTKEA